jgi:preprotein translocase subunit SecB
MATKHVQLEEFFLRGLHLDWQDSPSGKSSRVMGTSFNYQIARAREDPKRFRLELEVRFAPEEKRAAGYVGEAKITGFFSFPEGMSEPQMQYLARVNGCTILYGMLRGLIATCSGCFQGGKLNLPTVLFSEIVADIEKKRASLSKKSSVQRKGKKPKQVTH